MNPQMLYGLNDRPPVPTAAFVGFQHLLAMFGGILTAPLLIALGMGLPVEDTTYLISSALVISGFATLVQINRIGMLGAGLLSIQGTSFAFIGPLVFAYLQLNTTMSKDAALGVIFGSSAVCAVIMMVASIFIRQLRWIITTNVAGATIILLGISLVVVTLQNIQRAFNNAGGFEGEGTTQLLLAGVTFAVMVVLANIRQPWLRLASITIGLAVGIALSGALGVLDLSGVDVTGTLFFPTLARYPIGVDLQVVLIILPIFLVSAMESIGDLTATNNLSGLETGTDDYWERIRGGVMAGAFNSLVAVIFSTFPNTTFSQNNGVIRLTGVASRYIGVYVAVFLIILGCIPLVATFFQAIPGAVVYGATLLMFVLVGVSGYRVVEANRPGRRDWTIVTGAIVLGYVVALLIDRVPGLSEEVVMMLQFPVSTGAVIAILLEVAVPRDFAQGR